MDKNKKLQGSSHVNDFVCSKNTIGNLDQYLWVNLIMWERNLLN